MSWHLLWTAAFSSSTPWSRGLFREVFLQLASRTWKCQSDTVYSHTSTSNILISDMLCGNLEEELHTMADQSCYWFYCGSWTQIQSHVGGSCRAAGEPIWFHLIGLDILIWLAVRQALSSLVYPLETENRAKTVSCVSICKEGNGMVVIICRLCPRDRMTVWHLHNTHLHWMGMPPPRRAARNEWVKAPLTAGRAVALRTMWQTGYWVHSVAAGCSTGSGPAFPHRPQKQQVAPFKTALCFGSRTGPAHMRPAPVCLSDICKCILKCIWARYWRLVWSLVPIAPAAWAPQQSATKGKSHRSKNKPAFLYWWKWAEKGSLMVHLLTDVLEPEGVLIWHVVYQ